MFVHAERIHDWNLNDSFLKSFAKLSDFAYLSIMAPEMIEKQIDQIFKAT